MVDLMAVDWVRPRQRRNGAEPLHFWNAAGIEDQMRFAATWAESPRAHFERFSWGSTVTVLQLMVEIADRRMTYAVAGDDQTRWQSHQRNEQWAGLWHDTLDAVKYSPSHCGGWMGLLRVRLIPAQNAAVVDRPDPSGPQFYVTWPPSTNRSLIGVLNWFMQRFQPRPENYDGGNQWVPNQDMLNFIKGQKATGRYEQIAKTVAGLAYENSDRQLLHYYLSHLRGHGPEEPGRGGDHHLFQMVTSRDADATIIASDLDTTALDYVLKSFPAAWSQTSVGHWSAVVVEHINAWLKGMGNHPDGLTWLSNMLQTHVTRWSDMNRIRTLLGGTRDTQVTLGNTLSSNVTESVTQVEAISTSIELAYRQQTTEGWQRALTESLSRVESWQNTTRGGTSNTTGGSFGNTTAVTVGGETGALEEFLIGKLTGEATTTIQTQLHSQFTSHLEHERTSGGSTTTGRSLTTGQTLQQMREASYQMTQSASRSLTLTVQRGRSISQSAQTVRTIEGSLDRQIENVRQGLEDGKRYVDRARGP